MTAIADNLQRVAEALAAACRRTGRPESAARLVAVSKAKPAADVEEAYRAGHRDFGENRAQSLRARATELGALSEVRWHFIGALQRNKAKYVVGTAALIHTVDSERLLLAIEKQAAGRGVTQDVLVEVGLAGEAQKAGAAEEELRPLLERFALTPHVQCRGLMLMPPWNEDPEQTRPWFRRLRELAESIASAKLTRVAMDELSMGMSHDFEVAAEEGATLVRVGTAIFGER